MLTVLEVIWTRLLDIFKTFINQIPWTVKDRSKAITICMFYRWKLRYTNIKQYAESHTSLVQGSFLDLKALNPCPVPESHPINPALSPHILYVALFIIILLLL